MTEIQELIVYMLRAIESLGYAAGDVLVKKYDHQ
jgi:hypothetical protein